MMKIWEWVKKNPNRSMFLVPILLVAGISISHVVSWYDIANPISWAVYLSIAIEVGAMTALIAATNKIKGGVWFMFGIVTFIQMIGNIFFSYKEIDANGDLFKSWVELTGPIWESMGSDITDTVAMKRWLAFLEGGLLPIISLTSLHFFVKYEDSNPPKQIQDSPKKIISEDINEENSVSDSPKKEELPQNKEELIDEKNIDKLINLQRESDRVWNLVKELKESGKLPEDQTEEEISEEPSALAFTPYEINEEVEEENLTDDSHIIKNGRVLSPDGYAISKNYNSTTTTTIDNKTLTYTK
jgi:hypothetical protein